MEHVADLAELLKALAFCVLAIVLFQLRPDIGAVLRRISKIESRAKLRRMLARALEDEEPLIDVTPVRRVTRDKARKTRPTPELPAP